MICQTNTLFFSPLCGGGSAGGAGTSGNVPTWSAQPYYYMLLYQAYNGVQATAPTTLNQLFGWSPAWSDPAVYATNGTFANGRPVMTPGNDTGQTVNWANGTTNSIMLVGWSGNLGTSWLQVSNMFANWNVSQGSMVGYPFFGESATGYINPGQVNPGVLIFGGSGSTPTSTSYGLLIYNPSASPMNLYMLSDTFVIPEPSTFVLAGLGGLSLLLFRRQRK